LCYFSGVPRLLVVALAAALLAASATRARADIEGDAFESVSWRVRMSAPKNWQLTEKTAYPNILLRMVRRAPDGKMMLTAERLSPGVDALGYADRTAALLRQMGFQVRSPQLHSSTGAYFIDSQSRTAYLRQAFLVSGGIGYALTLSAPDNRTRGQQLRAFDFALRSIQIMPPGNPSDSSPPPVDESPPAPPSPALPAPPAPGGSESPKP